MDGWVVLDPHKKQSRNDGGKEKLPDTTYRPLKRSRFKSELLGDAV